MELRGTMIFSAARLTAFAFALLVSAQAAPARREGPGEEFKPFAVHIFRAQRQSWPGYGVYLGQGLVLTAAHVVGSPRNGDPSVEIAGATLPATFVKAGEFETVDLTLLHIDPRALPPSLGLRLMPVCEQPIRAGQAVVVVTPESAAGSHILPPKLLPANLRNRFSTVIADVATTGNSGSGVFDPVKSCLMGVMSRKLSVSTQGRTAPGEKPQLVDIAKYFVPAQEIKQFIAGN